MGKEYEEKEGRRKEIEIREKIIPLNVNGPFHTYWYEELYFLVIGR
jgi:hypothetical protein